MVGEDVEKLEPCALLVGMLNSVAMVKSSVVILQRNVELPFDIAVALLGTYPKELKTRILVLSMASSCQPLVTP